jgi:hypothetical protein
MHLRLSMMNPYLIPNFFAGRSTGTVRGLGIVADSQAGIVTGLRLRQWGKLAQQYCQFAGAAKLQFRGISEPQFVFVRSR